MLRPQRDPFRRKNDRRARALRCAAELTIRLRRPPTTNELAGALDVSHGNAQTIMRHCAREGLVDAMPHRLPHQPWPVILTPMARMLLGLPLLVYLTWPLPPPHAEDEAHEAAHALGEQLAIIVLGLVPHAAPVSPYLVKHRRDQRSQLDAAAPTLAMGCHAAIIYRDPMLVGRADAAAAKDAGLPTSIVDMPAIERITRGHETIWSPPNLLTR